jgi:hypothetical protein
MSSGALRERFAAETGLMSPAKLPKISTVKKTDTDIMVNTHLLITLEMS